MQSVLNHESSVIEFFENLYEWSGVDELHPLYEPLNMMIKTDKDVNVFNELYDGDHECLDTTVNKMIELVL